jgi:hypothetical protein
VILRNTAPGDRKGWDRHPAADMWRNHPVHLARYGLACCQEWESRGYEDNMARRIESIRLSAPDAFQLDEPPPPWLGAEDFHRAHRANLVRKNREHYAHRFEPDIDDALPYIWPGRATPARPRSGWPGGARVRPCSRLSCSLCCFGCP